MLLVLIAVAMCTIMALSFLAAQEPTAVVASNIDRKAKARAIAESALTMAIDYVNESATWRIDQSSGQWMAGASLDGGTFDLYGIDEDDGDLADDERHPVDLVVVATYQGVTHRVVAVVTPGEPIFPEKKLLLVVVNATSLNTLDQTRKNLFESWGYTVTLIDDGASDEAFDAAASENNVVYISETVASGSVSDAFVDVGIGVVNEEPYLHDEFGFTTSNLNAGVGTTTMFVVDNGHPITAGLPLGALGIADSAVSIRYATSEVASGVTVLTDRSAVDPNAMLMIAEPGAMLHTGLAAGKRVMWGFSGHFDVMDFNADGQALLRRAVDWASQDGLDAKWFYASGSWPSQLSDIEWSSTPDQMTVETMINWAHAPAAWEGGHPAEEYGLELTGVIRIPETGDWTFYLSSDDGSELVVDGVLLVDHDGPHAMTERTGTLALIQGQVISIRVRFFERNSYQGLTLSWSGPEHPKEIIPESAYKPVVGSSGPGGLDWDEPD